MTKQAGRAILTDLDGVFFDLVDHEGECGVSARHQSEVRVVLGLAGELDALVDRGFLLVGITNQPDISRGKITREFLADKHASLLKAYPQIQKIFCCEHTESDLCQCRKPKPGLILAAAREFGLELSKSWVVGDSRTDIEAGVLAHCRTAFVQTAHNIADPGILAATFVARSAKKAFATINEIDCKEGSQGLDLGRAPDSATVHDKEKERAHVKA